MVVFKGPVAVLGEVGRIIFFAERLMMGQTGVTRKMITADISLFFVAVFWGSNFVIMKEALEVIAPFTYLGLRFLVATLFLAPLFWKRVARASSQDLAAGCLIGFFLFAGFSFQTVGLLYTTPAKSGFITGIAVVIVPFLYYLVTKRFPGWAAFVGGGLAACGLYLLTVGDTFNLGFGDMLTLISAFLFASHIIAIALHAPRRDPLVLAVIQIAFTGLASTVMALFFESTAGMFIHPPLIWGAILYAVLFCTIGAFVTQTTAQRFTPPAHVALILSLEAVFAGIFSYFFWGELFTVRKLSGAMLILLGIIIAELSSVIAAKSAARQAAMFSAVPPD